MLTAPRVRTHSLTRHPSQTLPFPRWEEGWGERERRTSISLLESRRLKEAPLAGFHIKLSRDHRLGVYPCTVTGRILPRRLTSGPSVPL